MQVYAEIQKCFDRRLLFPPLLGRLRPVVRIARLSV